MNKLNKQVIQNVTDSAVKIAKAFTIESKDGVVKPELNHTDVVASELAAAKYNTMVLEGGVNEISNFDTNEDFITNINEWKRKVSEQSVKMFQLAEKSLVQNKSLQKVIILKRIFRCDNKIKESLSQFANSVYDDIWRQKGCPRNIVIADQKLQCEGSLRVLRYGNEYHRNFDGVHLRGDLATQHYTKSIIGVFTDVFPHLLASTTQNTANNTTTSGN